MTNTSVSRENLERVLRDHYLAGIHCDHEAKTDKPSCSCSMWNCAPQPTIGEAAERWVEHVLTKCDDIAALASADRIETILTTANEVIGETEGPHTPAQARLCLALYNYDPVRFALGMKELCDCESKDDCVEGMTNDEALAAVKRLSMADQSTPIIPV